MISDAIRAMEYVIDKNIRLSNNSWGGGDYSQSMYDTIEASQAIGHIFVAAAGNLSRDNDITPYYPATYDLPNIIAVAATDNDDNLADFSNYGATSVELGAPGVNIYSTVLNTGYAYYEGTSMAAPHVTGVAALVMSRYGGIPSDTVRDRILATVRPVESLNGVTVTGGVVNAPGALSDCNDNGVPDEQDIAGATSEDCTGNTIPDECEADCNDNGQADSCDILDDPSLDCDENGIPDECEEFRDCNGNGVYDPCDIRDGFSEDINSNGIPDECEADCNDNDIPDTLDIAEGTSDDCNENMVPDECEPDCNGNGIADECDVVDGTSEDCNGNIVPDECDIGEERWPDDNGNGTLDVCEAVLLFVDTNASGARTGLNWTDAFTDLQDGFGVLAGAGTAVEQIWIAGGTYTPDRGTFDRTAAFELVGDVTLYGGFAGGESSVDERDPATNVTILSGDLFDDDGPDWTNRFDNSFTIVYVPDSTGTPTIDGLTITAGNAAGAAGETIQRFGGGMFFDHYASASITNCTFTANSADSGGAISLLQHCCPVLTDCTFSGNSAGLGGGIVTGAYSEPVLTRCTFNDNTATHWGGGVCIGGEGSPTLTDCTFSGNWSANVAGAMMALSFTELTATNCTFSNNSAYVGGAVVSAYRGNPVFAGCTFSENLAQTGGGAYIYDTGNLTAIDCMFSENTAEYGGGACAADMSTPTLIGCTFTGNVATARGGGMRNMDGAAPTLRDCTFANNWAEDRGGGMYNSGGTTPNIVGCRFSYNSVGDRGAGMYNVTEAAPTMINCIFNGNTAPAHGGAMRNYGATATLVNCAFIGNEAMSGGGISNGTASDTDLTNCTFYGNVATSSWGAGGLRNQESNATVTNCVFWGNSNTGGSTENTQITLYGSGSTADVNYSCIQGWTGILGGFGNHGDDPAFQDPDGDDGILATEDDNIRLSVGSPCVDTGDNTSVPPDTLDLDEDGDTDESVPFDLAGYARFFDEPDTPDGGNGEPPIVDMGCYEFLVDCNNNGVLDDQDILEGTSQDCNENGIPDECDIAGATSEDCQQNDVPDECDIAGPTSEDCNKNGVPDECDIAGPTSEDCNSNDVPDECDIAGPTSEDCNSNDVPDECDIAGPTSEDCNSNDVPDECEPDEDCNTNGVQDICDIADGVSEDCNDNRTPDECEPDEDCNNNGIQDICDIAECSPGDPDCDDCQSNGIPDWCDIEYGGYPDTNGNGIPDMCDAAPPSPEPGGTACAVASDCTDAYEGADCVAGTCYIPKNRYLSVDPTVNESPAAYQVEIVEAADYPDGLGRTWWVDEPACLDKDANVCPGVDCIVDPVPPDCVGLDLFGWVSGLSGTPVTRSWTEVPVHVTGCGIAPVVRYHIRASADEGGWFSDPLEIATAHNPDGPSQSWGDITGGPVPGMPGLWLPPDGSTNMADVGNAVRTFENQTQDTGCPPRVWVDVESNQVINMADIQFIIGAFEGVAYADVTDLDFIGVHPGDCP